MAYYLLQGIPIRQADAGNSAISGAKLHTWNAGTQVNRATYTDSTGGTPHPNPIVADVGGQFPQIWIDSGAYDLEARVSADTTVLWQSLNVRAPEATIAVSLAGTASATDGVGMVGYSPTLTYPSLTIGALMGKKVLIDLYGASTAASGATNDAAFSSALAILSASAFGGQIVYGRGQYRHASTVVVDVDDVEIVGSGGSGQHNTLTPAGSTGGTQLAFGNTAGAGVWLKAVGTGLRKITVTSDATRYALAYSVSTPGVRIEAADAVGAASARTCLEDVQICWQPGDGFQAIGDIVSSDFIRVDCNNVKGYGRVYDGGTYRSRTNVQRPGIFNDISGRNSRTGGCAIRCGDPTTDATERPYRGYFLNSENFYNRRDATFPAYCAYIGGEQMRFVMGAVSGETDAGVGDHSGFYSWGNSVYWVQTRFVDCEPSCGVIDDPAAAVITTTSVKVFDPYINNANQAPPFYTLANPAFPQTSTCQNCGVEYNAGGSDVASNGLMSAGATNSFREQRHIREFKGTFVARNLKALENGLSIADDQAYYIEFSDIARGILAVSGNLAARGSFLIHFRCGDGSGSIDLTSLTPGVTITDGGAGTLTGVTGTDTHLTVRYSTTLNRLYIENRTGALGVYEVTLISCNAEIETVAVST